LFPSSFILISPIPSPCDLENPKSLTSARKSSVLARRTIAAYIDLLVAIKQTLVLRCKTLLRMISKRMHRPFLSRNDEFLRRPAPLLISKCPLSITFGAELQIGTYDYIAESARYFLTSYKTFVCQVENCPSVEFGCLGVAICYGTTVISVTSVADSQWAPFPRMCGSRR